MIKLSKYFPILLLFFNLFIECTLYSPYNAQKYHRLLSTSLKRNKKFNPTLNNLNTITLTPLSQQESEHNSPIITISELANAICDHYAEIKDETILSIKNQNIIKDYCKIHKGIYLTSHEKEQKENNIVTVYSRGFARESRPISSSEGTSLYRNILHYIFPVFQVQGLPQKGGGALSTYAAYRDDLIHTPCITFDYPDTNNHMNVAQTLDIACLDTIVKNIPTTQKTVYLGASRGATALLKHELLNERNQHPCAMILESPFLSMHDTMSQIARKCFWNIPFSSTLAYNAFRWLYPNYNPQEDNLTELLPNINPDIPLLIIHLKEDPYISDAGMFKIVHTLAHYNKNIHLLVLTDTTGKAHHGKLSRIKAFQKTANAFLQQNAIPHSECLAEQGQQLLSSARKNAYNCSSPAEWNLTPCFN